MLVWGTKNAESDTGVTKCQEKETQTCKCLE